MAWKRSATWVQFDVGSTKRFRITAGEGQGMVTVPTTGLTCQVRLQRVDDKGAPLGEPIVANAAADDESTWRFTLTSAMSATPGSYEFEARLDNGSGEVVRWPDETRAQVTVRPVRTGGSS